MAFAVQSLSRMRRRLWRKTSRWILRFDDPGVEAGFVKQNSSRFLSTAFPVFLALTSALGLDVISSLLGVVPGPFAGSCDVPPISKSVYQSLRYWFCALTVAFTMFLKAPILLRKVDPFQRERLIVLYFSMLQAWQHLCHPFYLTKLFGGHLDKSCTMRKINSPDLFIILMSANAIVTSHLTVPIRWCNLILVEGTTLLANGFCVFALGSPEGVQRSVLHFVLLCVLIFLIAMGKRNTERAERDLFMRLLSEKTLRTQAEFELSRIQSKHDVRRGEVHELQSVTVPSTSPTEQAFRDIEGEGRAKCLETLIEIGHKEQWLIDAKEVCMTRGDTLLGHGGFGMVVSASFHGSPVAVKAPLRKHQSTLSLADIGNELRILRRLRHPHIVLCHGAIIESGCGELALVLELVRGQCMRNFIDVKHGKGQMPSCDARCQCVLGICCALAYLHSRNPRVVHGDLKASNIMIQRLRSSSADLEVVHAKILDFGISRVLTRSAKPLGGTVRWKAPELFRRPAVKPDRAADVYSFGCLLFFAVSGKQPLDQLDKDEIKYLQQQRANLRLTWPQDSTLIGQCEMMVDQATRVDPTMRPSMQQIYEDLVQWPEVRKSHSRKYGFLYDLAHAAPKGSSASQRLWREIRSGREAFARQDGRVAPQPRARSAAAVEGSQPTLLGRPSSAPVTAASQGAEHVVPVGDVQHLQPSAPPFREVHRCMQL